MSTPTHRILAVNTGSSSLKAALYQVGADAKLLLSVSVEGVGQSDGQLRVHGGAATQAAPQHAEFRDQGAATAAVLEILTQRDLRFAAVSHRIVQGGPDYSAPTLIDAALLSTLRRISQADPEHGPGALAAIKCAQQLAPELPQIACFDTAFHRSMPANAQHFALPPRFFEQGLRRYGFHGLSYQSVIAALRHSEPALAQGRVIVAHLGNGASLAALHGGVSVETSMGFTPQSGLMMGTRAGDIDSGVLLQLLGEAGLSVAELRTLLNRESGLLGVSGRSADMRELLQHRDVEPGSALAIDMFCHRVRQYLGAYIAVLGGLDALVFTGGIGEHAAPVREQICARLDCFGIRLDHAANQAGAAMLDRPGSPVALRVIASDEGRMLALQASRLLSEPTNTWVR